MNEWFSKFIFGLSWGFAAAALFTTCLFLDCLVEGNQVGFIIFLFYALPFFVGSLILIVLPSVILYRRKKRRRDWLTFCISGASCLLICFNIALLILFPGSSRVA